MTRDQSSVLCWHATAVAAAAEAAVTIKSAIFSWELWEIKESVILKNPPNQILYLFQKFLIIFQVVWSIVLLKTSNHILLSIMKIWPTDNIKHEIRILLSDNVFALK